MAQTEDTYTTKTKWSSHQGIRNRFWWIVGAFIIGIIIVICFHELTPTCLSDNDLYCKLKDSIQFLLFLLGLPLFVVLWVFRTYDNNHREFFEAVGILGEKPRTGLVLLMQLRNRKKVFIEEIDKATSGSNFLRKNFSNLDLREINLSKSKLVATNLTGADLRGATLKETDLKEAIFKKAKLEGANLEEAMLHRANLEEARLEGADLRGAFLEEAKLMEAYLEGAIYNSKTKFDKDFEPELHGMIHKEEQEEG